MNTELEVIRKAYKLDEDIRHSLATEPENSLTFDRTWNGNYAWKYWGICNGPKLEHREEKCRHTRGGYSKELVNRFEKILLDIDGVNQEIVNYVEKKDIEKKLGSAATVGIRESFTTKNEFDGCMDRDSKMIRTILWSLETWN